MTIRLLRHVTLGIKPAVGSFEVRFSDGRESVYFYWDNDPGRRLRPDAMTEDAAKAAAQEFARRSAR